MSCSRCNRCKRCGDDIEGNDRWSKICLRCANKTIEELRSKLVSTQQRTREHPEDP